MLRAARVVVDGLAIALVARSAVACSTRPVSARIFLERPTTDGTYRPWSLRVVAQLKARAAYDRGEKVLIEHVSPVRDFTRRAIEN
jgi:hypothetical protein